MRPSEALFAPKLLIKDVLEVDVVSADSQGRAVFHSGAVNFDRVWLQVRRVACVHALQGIILPCFHEPAVHNSPVSIAKQGCAATNGGDGAMSDAGSKQCAMSSVKLSSLLGQQGYVKRPRGDGSFTIDDGTGSLSVSGQCYRVPQSWHCTMVLVADEPLLLILRGSSRVMQLMQHAPSLACLSSHVSARHR